MKRQKFVSRSVVLLSIFWLCSCATSPLGRKQLKILPSGQVDAMGAQSFAEMKSKTPRETRSDWVNYVNCVTRPLTEISNRQSKAYQWEVVVFRSQQVNAFALPGGKIGVYTGLIRVAQTDAQLAAVIGHEIGHVIAEHGNERVSQGLATTIAVQGISGMWKDPESRARAQGLLGLGANVGLLLPFGRTQESESDVIGLGLMAQAGFDPRESVRLWENMARAGGAAPPEFLSTHPSHSTRIRGLKSQMKGALAQYERARAAGKKPACQRPRG